jgi:hypothetical protein
MALYLLSAPSLQVFDENGDPLEGALLYTYAAGTSTPLNTYSDVDGTVPNMNPIVADASGRFGDIFLTLAIAYKFVLNTVDNVTVYTVDNFVVPALSTTSADTAGEVAELLARPVQVDCCDGRLTLTTAVPVTTADVTAATTVYYTPYVGNRIALFDGVSEWSNLSFTQLSIALGTDAINLPYDVFAYNNAGVVAIERLAWSSLTARATTLVTQDGVLVKSGQTTRRYLGTYRTTGTVGQTEDSAAKRYVWNYYHRSRKPLTKVDATATWNYTTATYQQANASTANQVELVCGWAESMLELAVYGGASNGTANVAIAVSIGEDAITSVAGVIGRGQAIQVISTFVPVSAFLCKMPAVGGHYYTWLEKSAATGTTAWIGTSGDQVSGLIGHWAC